MSIAFLGAFSRSGNDPFSSKINALSAIHAEFDKHTERKQRLLDEKNRIDGVLKSTEET